jgi:ubiquinone/menaquinone biosynthesis C-methylase UbiE
MYIDRRNMAKAYDFYEKIAQKYDEMYEDITWNVHHEIIRRILSEEIIARTPVRIMDLGAGTGRWALYFAGMGMEVTAVEPSKAMIDVMKEKIPAELTEKIKLVKVAAEKMEFSQEFDLVNAQGDVLSYLEDPNEGLQRIRKALKPGGLFIGTVDSKYWFLKDLSKMGDFAEISSIEKNPVLFVGNTSVNLTFKTRLFTSKTLYELLETHGFEILEISGMIVFGPYEDDLHPKFDEIVENEMKYRTDPLLVDQAMHLHFKAIKK